ncbi:hypothetical protein [Nocardioides pakistanensis]
MNNLDEKDLLVHELRERSSDVGGHPIGFAAVRQSAKRIQRRRHLVTGGVAALVASIALPTGVAVNSALDGAGQPDRQPTFATSPTQATPSEAPTAPSGPVTLTLDGLERGAEPGIDYLLGTELVRADGTRVQLEREYQQIAPFDDGWVALWQENGEYTRDFLDADGTVRDSMPSAPGLAVNQAGTQVAYSQVDGGKQQIFDATGLDARTVEDPDGTRPLTPVGYAGNGVLVFKTEGDPGQVYVYDERSKVYEVPANPKLISARGTSQAQGLVAGQLSYNEDGTSCWTVVSYKTGNQLFGKTCDWTLEKFSPDGRYVVGTPSDGDGVGPRGFAILSAQTGDVLTEFEQDRDGQLFLGDPVWEDEAHVLATVVDGLESRVVRFGLDGSMEVASDPVTGEDYEMPSPIRFATQP